MQNLATPTDLVKEELSLRVKTLANDRHRLLREHEEATRNLKEATEALRDNHARYEQILAARLAYEPASQAKPVFRKVVGGSRGIGDLPPGTVVRVLFQNTRRDGFDGFVTIDPDLPVLSEDWVLFDGLFESGRTFWLHSQESVESVE